jgi:hypothetical protein
MMLASAKTDCGFSVHLQRYKSKMATNAIINASNIDISKITFGEIRTNKAGGKSVPIKYNGQNLQLRIPKMAYMAGVNTRVDETSGNRSYTIPASLTGCDSYAKERNTAGTEVGNLYNFLFDMQEKIIKTAVEKSVAWFSKARKEEVLRDSFKAILSPSVEKVNGEWVPNGKYPPSFRMKIPVYDGQVSMEAVSASGAPIALTENNLEQVFPKRVEARIVASPTIYVSALGFGVTWRVTYAQVFPTQRVTAAQVFMDELEEETAIPTPAAAPLMDLDDDADVEETHEEANEETPAPAPAPVPAKNRRRGVVAA